MDGITITATASAARFASRLQRLRSFVETEGAKATEAQMRNIRQVIINTSPVDTGALKASWSPVTARGQLAYGIDNPRPYAAILEYGGYRGVGPRTERLGGGELGAGFVAGPGVYSQQAPLGFVRKALAGAVPQFRLRLKNMLAQGWGGLGAPSEVLGTQEAADIFGIDLSGGASTGFTAPVGMQNLRDLLTQLRSETGIQ